MTEINRPADGHQIGSRTASFTAAEVGADRRSNERRVAPSYRGGLDSRHAGKRDLASMADLGWTAQVTGMSLGVGTRRLTVEAVDARCFPDLLPPLRPSSHPHGRETRRPTLDLVTVGWVLIGVLKL
ncbi:hypothetical protein V6N13_087470 [Hibiscus sabdariffa]